MDANILKFVNITIDCYSFLIISFILTAMVTKKSKRSKNNIWLILTIVSALIWSFMDMFTWICESKAYSWYIIGLHVSNFIFYLFGYGLVFFFALYLFDYIGGVILTRNCRHVVYLTGIIYLILLILTPFTGLLYKIDANNHYSRGEYIYLVFILEGIIYITALIYLFRNRDYIQFINLRAEISFIILPQAMQILQLGFFGISLVPVGYTLAIILIFMDVNRKLEKNYDKTFEVVRQRDAKLIRIQNHTILSLSSLVEERDTDTGGHVQRTSDYVGILATLLRNKGLYTNTIDDRYIKLIIDAAPMHDIGKIVVSDAVLKKPAKLTDEEFEQMKRHALEGGRIIKEVLSEYEDQEYKRIATDIATYHHEKWDGTGYPNGLKSDSIPLCARIMALADVFDALVSPRVYKQPMSYEKAFEIIEAGAGVHFDPVITRVFIENKEIMKKINENYIEEQKRHLYDNSDNDIEILEELEEV